MRERKSVILPVSVYDDQTIKLQDIGLLGQILRNQNRIEKVTAENVAMVLNANENTIRKGLVRLCESGYLLRESRNSGYFINYEGICANRCQTGMEVSADFALSILSSKTAETKEKKEAKKRKNYKQDILYNNTIESKKNEKERDKRERKTGEVAEPEGEEPKRGTRFVKPTVEEVRAYCRERRSTVYAQSFWDFYESKGWMVGKNHMKDWKAAVRTWEQKDRACGRTYIPAENREDDLDSLPF